MRLLTIVMMLGIALLAGCGSGEYDPSLGEPGPNGEPDPGMHHAHSIQFRVTRADYAAALTEFYEFTQAEVFETFKFGDCFAADPVDDQDVPCIGMYAVKGSPVKAHMTFTILAKSAPRLARNDFLTCRIDIYVHGTYQPVASIGPRFASRVDDRLHELDARVAAVIRGK